MLLEEQYTAPENQETDSQQIDEQASVDVVDNANQESSDQSQEEGESVNQQPAKKNEINERFRHYSKTLKEKDAVIRAQQERIAQLEAPPQAKVNEQEETPPDPEDPKFKTVHDYISELTQYNARKILREERKAMQAKDAEENAKRELYQIHDEWSKRLAQAQKELPDWETVVDSADAQASPIVQEELLRSEKGPHVAYYLAKNPDVLEKLNSIGRRDPRAVVREIAKLEINLSMKQSSPLNRKPSPPSEIRGSTPAGKINKADLPMDQFYKLKMQGKI